MAGASGDTEDRLRAAVATGLAAPFDALLCIAPNDGEAIWIDGAADPPRVLPAAPADNKTPACTLSGGRDALARALSSARAFAGAYVSGRIAVAGDMSVMARLALPEKP